MEHNMEPLMDFHSNLPEMLAVDLEQSSNIFQSKHLTAGAPAPGLAADGAARRYSLPYNSGYLSPMFPSRPHGPLYNSKSLQTIHHKYSDIFAPLDFHSPQRGSISSSDSSADFEPPSLSTREASLLTVDTWFEPEKQPLPILLHISPTSEFSSPMSWIDLNGEDQDNSPIIKRRNNSLTEYPQHVEQPSSPNHGGGKNILSSAQNIDIAEAFTISTSGVLPRQSQGTGRSTKHREQLLDLKEAPYDTEESTSAQHLRGESYSLYDDDTDSLFLQNEINFALRDNMSLDSSRGPHSSKPQGGTPSKPNTSEDKGARSISQDELDVEEWLISDMEYPVCEERVALLPLSYGVQDMVRVRVTSFPRNLLKCEDLLVEDVRNLSRRVRHNTADWNWDDEPNNQQAKLPNWKWIASSTSRTEQQDQPDGVLAERKRAWNVMWKIFPRGSDEACEALYAYVLVYNYLTSLYRHKLSRPDTARPDTSESSANSDSDMSISTPPRPSASEEMGIPRKAIKVLGLAEFENLDTASSGHARQQSGGSGSRKSTLTGLRNISSRIFNGMGQVQPRQNESRGTVTASATLVGPRSSLSRPATPAVSRTCMSPIPYEKEQSNLAELRRGVARCCARLAIDLKRADPAVTRPKSDETSEVDLSLMRSLCHHVHMAEEALGAAW
ncbi:hypothetical protein F4802DRAFT_172599 [Xylaria palmicola]|nr:hypothetical protein F4802DRAFT_172599 [Xylaria palmicola]